MKNCCVIRRKEWRKRLFNDTFNTFYLQLYDIGHMVKDHSARNETHCCHFHGLLLLITARDLLYAPTYRQDIVFFTPVVEYCLEQEISQRVHHEESIQWPITPWGIDPMTHHTMSRCFTVELEGDWNVKDKLLTKVLPHPRTWLPKQTWPGWHQNLKWTLYTKRIWKHTYTFIHTLM